MLNSLILRLASMALKFVFLVVAASHLPAEEIALFGKINGMVLLLIYLIALDLYIATSRTIANQPRVFHTLLSNQILVSTVLFVATIPLLIWAFSGATSVAAPFLVLLVVSELVSQEFYRLNISFGDYMKANVLFFIKTGGWTGVASLGIALGMITDMGEIIVVWLVSALIATLYGWVSVRKYAQGFRFRPDVRAFFRALRNNILIFTSSLTLIVLGTVDKIYLGTFGDSDKTAAYVFFSSIAGAATTLIYTGVVNPNYGKLVNPDTTEFEIRQVIRKIAIAAMAMLILLLFAVFVLIGPLLVLMGREYLHAEKPLLWLISLSVLMNTLSLVPHFYLLAHKRDKLIAIASAVGILVYLAMLHPFFLLWGTPSVAVSVAIGFLALFFVKSIFAVNLARTI